DQRVARLVIGDRPLLGVTDDHRPPLDPHQDLVLGVLEVRHLDELLVLSRGEEGGLVDEVREVGPRKAGSAPRQYLQLDVRRRRRRTAAISSMKMIQGACLLPLANRSRTRAAPTLANISTKSDPAIEKKGAFASPAIALARRVLPVPGGPPRRTAFGVFPPTR